MLSSRAVGRSKNPGEPVSFGGHNLPPLVEIGLTDLSKYAMAPPAPGTTGLVGIQLKILSCINDGDFYLTLPKIFEYPHMFIAF